MAPTTGLKMSGRVGNMVHLLWFRTEGLDEADIFSVRTCEEQAKEAIERLRQKKMASVDFPQGFEIYQDDLDRDRWAEGFKYTE